MAWASDIYVHMSHLKLFCLLFLSSTLKHNPVSSEHIAALSLSTQGYSKLNQLSLAWGNWHATYRCTPKGQNKPSGWLFLSKCKCQQWYCMSQGMSKNRLVLLLSKLSLHHRDAHSGVFQIICIWNMSVKKSTLTTPSTSAIHYLWWSDT